MIITIPQRIMKIKDALGDDAQLHLVGGCIRDCIMNKEPKDFDLATILHPEEVEKRCKDAGIPTIRIGIRRGTISAIIAGEAFEITTFRKQGRETSFSTTIEEDLSARDFSINSIAYNLHTCKIVDPYNGIQDINTGILISVGSAKHRFYEDPHRIIRMCRFAAQFGFKIRAEEYEAAKEFSYLMKSIEPERINAELKKIFVGLKGTELFICLNHLDNVKFFDLWIPEISACKGVTQNKYHTFDVYDHIIKVVSGCTTYHSKLAAFFHDIGKPLTKTTEENGDVHFYQHEDVGAEMAETIMKRLKFSNYDIDIVKRLVALHMRPIDCGKKAMRKLKALFGDPDIFEAWKELKYADKIRGAIPPYELELWHEKFYQFENLLAEIEAEEEIYPTTQLAIDGFDVMNLFQLKACPKVGAHLDKCKEFIFEFPEKNNEEDLKKFLLDSETRIQP